MSYLVQHLPRERGGVVRPLRRGARVDERLRLNREGYCGDAYVRVFVEDTSRRARRRGIPEPRIKLRIADCSNVIALEFDVSTAGFRENSLFKIDTLLGALTRFRRGLVEESELYAARERR